MYIYMVVFNHNYSDKYTLFYMNKQILASSKEMKINI